MDKIALNEILVSPETKIIDVIKRLDKLGCGVIIVVDSTRKLLGTITDGDLRRAMLRGVSFESSCDLIFSDNPVYANNNACRDEIKRLFDKNPKRFSLQQIPLVNDKFEVVDLALRKDFMTPQINDHWIVIMAGGLGSRLNPLTLDCPKPLLKLSGKPVLEILLESFIDEGFFNFLISVNYKGEMIRRQIGDGRRWGVNIDYLVEEKRLGTAGPLSLISPRPEKPFIVVNSDILTKINFTSLVNYHKNLESDATMCVRQYDCVIPYGVVELDDHQIVNIKEKPSYSYFVNSGIYVLSPSVIDLVPRDTYFDMTELMSIMSNCSKKVCSYPMHEYWIDIGRIEDLERAHQEYQEIFQ